LTIALDESRAANLLALSARLEALIECPLRALSMFAVEEPTGSAGRTANGSTQSGIAGKSSNGSPAGSPHCTASERALLSVRHARTTHKSQADSQNKYD
jgi:hypothetical protein